MSKPMTEEEYQAFLARTRAAPNMPAYLVDFMPAHVSQLAPKVTPTPEAQAAWIAKRAEIEAAGGAGEWIKSNMPRDVDDIYGALHARSSPKDVDWNQYAE